MSKKSIQVRNVKGLGAVVRQVRKSQHVSQVELSQLTNLGSRFVVDFEAGKPTLQFGKAMEVLKTLGVRLYAEIDEDVPNA